MIRETSRRRRRSRSPSPGRSKRMKSRSRDRRGRDIAPPAMREPERFVDPVAPRQRERAGGRGGREDRRVTRSRERDMDGRHGGPNSLTMSGGGMRGGSGGGREREREVHVRPEMPHVVTEYRAGGGGGGGGMMPGRMGMPIHGSHVPQPYLNGSGGRMDMSRGGASDFRGGGGGGGGEYPGGGGMAINGHGHGRGGYPVVAPSGGFRGRSVDRDRERERDRDRERAMVIERERVRDRERERERQDRDKERVLQRERDERARMREIKAAEDRRASEAHALRRETLRKREEAAALKAAAARGRDGSGAPVPHSGDRARDRDRDRERERDRAAPRAPRTQTREGREGREGRGRDRASGAGRAAKGTYMSKPEIDKLFLKVLEKMGEDNSRFPCTASLINDRMKNENPGYNVANSEYQRFSNVLSRFESDKMVGTSKANDSLQVNWTKWSAPGSGTGARRPDNRRETDDVRLKIRPSRAGGMLQLYFCSAAEEDGVEKRQNGAPSSGANGGGDGDGGGGGDGSGSGEAEGVALVGGAATPNAEIASILQERGELLLAPPPAAPKKPDAAAAAAVTESGSGDPMDEEAGAGGAAAAEETPAMEGEDSADKDDKKADVADDVKEPESNGVDDSEATATATATATSEADADAADADAEKEGAPDPAGGTAEGQAASNGVAGGGDGSPETKKPEEEERIDDADVYRRDMGWLRSANGMVAEVTTPSLGVGYKIAIMIHQRCKPCLCLFNKNLRDAEGNPAAPAHLSPILAGDRNLDIREYSEVSEIGAIVDHWIEKQFPNKGPNSRRGSRGGRADSRGRGSRERPGRKRADKDDGGGGRGDGGGKGAEGGSGGGRRGSGNKNDDDDDDDQSVAEGARGDGDRASGERTESVISDDGGGGDDEHEEVEDITGDYAAGAATSDAGVEVEESGRNGAVEEEDEEDGGMVSNDESVQ